MSDQQEMEIEDEENQEEVDSDLEEDEEEAEDSSDDEPLEEKIFVPGTKTEECDGELEVDENAYILYHQVMLCPRDILSLNINLKASLGPPCLSFDIIHETCKYDFPLTVMGVAGTQASKVTANSLIAFRMSNLHSVRPVQDDEDEDDVEDPEEEKPVLKMSGLKHPGTVNRVKYAMIGPTPVVAAWSEAGSVGVWNLTSVLARLELPGQDGSREEASPLQTFTGHSCEGYALDWSQSDTGVLASGDCNKNIHVWKPGDNGQWSVSEKPYSSHTSSVEDIKWSPNEKTVMASCSCDKTIKIWDIRADPGKACMLTQGGAHTSDVNVIDWNRNEPFIVSGGDDGVVKVWDLRQFSGLSEPVATFQHHSGPVTSVEWHPEDSSVFASSGEDHQVWRNKLLPFL